MGSGLILLVIVGASLAVLVPVGLRSYDGGSRGDAPGPVRVLPRRRRLDEVPTPRSTSAGSTLLVPPSRRAVALAHARYAVALAVGWAGAGLARCREASEELRDRWQEHRATRLPLSPAARRRRVLGTLVLGALAALVAGRWTGSRALLVGAGLLAVLAVLFVALCWQQAVHRRAELSRARDEGVAGAWDDDEAYETYQSFGHGADEAAAHEVVARGRVGHEPAGPEPAGHEPAGYEPAGHEPRAHGVVAQPYLAEPAAPAHPQPYVHPEWVEPAAASYPPVGRPARRAGRTPDPDGGWEPVPVPLPTYLGKDVAGAPPARPRARAAWEAGLQDEAPAAAPRAREPEQQRRRAAGDW